MELYTLQMAKWRVAKAQGILTLDTTMKTGEEVFAPHRQMVYDVKAGRITEAQYTEMYYRKMRESYRDARHRWIEVCQLERLAIMCYCPEGVFCHRHLLRKYFEPVCVGNDIPFTYMGELK